MKAYVLHGIDDLRYEEAAKPVPESSEVLVRVMAAGICGSDIPRIFETGAHRHPLIPGHEFSGVVEAVGSKHNKEWLGKRVGVFPLIPCYECAPCVEKQYEMCRQYSYLGSRRGGGFAEYVAVPSWNLIELPENVSFEEAAMLEPMAVAVHAMRSAAPKMTDTVAVCGLGTIGLLTAMFLKDAGIENLLLIGNKDLQKEMALQMGIDAEHFCDIRTQDAKAWITEKTRGNGTNVFFECVGRNETISMGLACAAPGGTVLLVGNPASDVRLSREDYWQILRRQLTVRGTWNSSFTHEESDDWHYALGRLSARQINPVTFISHRLPFDRLERGLAIMRDKTEDFCKIMIRIANAGRAVLGNAGR